MNATDGLKRLALRVLARMGSEPMAQEVLRDALHAAYAQLPTGDLDQAIKELEADGYPLRTPREHRNTS